MIDWPEDIAADSVQHESQFKVAWQTTQGAPLVRAMYGGILADRLSWVFIAGYQGAMRLAFNGIPDDQWWSFAVSEDRTGKLAGVELRDKTLHGTKTWVAACDSVDGVFVTAANQCFRIPRGHEGVTFERYPSSSFLPDMSTGKVTLTNADAGFVTNTAMDFRLAEPVALMAASLGYLWREGRRLNASTIVDDAESIAARLAEIDKHDPTGIAPLYVEVADLGKQCALHAADRADVSQADWQQNGRLLSLYKKALVNAVG